MKGDLEKKILEYQTSNFARIKIRILFKVRR